MSSVWSQFYRRCARLGSSHVLRKPLHSPFGVLFQISAIDQAFQSGASGSNCTNLELLFPRLNEAPRILFEYSVPTSGLVAPRPHEHSSLNDDHPDDNRAVTFRSSADVNVRSLIDSRQFTFRPSRA